MSSAQLSATEKWQLWIEFYVWCWFYYSHISLKRFRTEHKISKLSTLNVAATQTPSLLKISNTILK